MRNVQKLLPNFSIKKKMNISSINNVTQPLRFR